MSIIRRTTNSFQMAYFNLALRSKELHKEADTLRFKSSLCVYSAVGSGTACFASEAYPLIIIPVVCLLAAGQYQSAFVSKRIMAEELETISDHFDDIYKAQIEECEKIKNT